MKSPKLNKWSRASNAQLQYCAGFILQACRGQVVILTRGHQKKLLFPVQCPCPTCSGLRSETLMSKMVVPVSLSPELVLPPTKKTSDSGEV